MDRRTYLAAVAASSVAGCLDGVASGSTPSPTPAVPEGRQREVHLAAVDDAGHDLSMTAAVTEPTVTDEHPARVRVTTTNEGRERDLSVDSGMCCLFNRSGGASDPRGLWLHRVGAADGIERDGDRWTRDAAADQSRAYAAYACIPRTFGRGESVTNEYHVWDDYRVEGYLQPGTYRFAERVTVSEPGEDLEGAVLAKFEWGLSLRVERP